MTSLWSSVRGSEVKAVDTKDVGSFPRDCSKGPGWKGNLETFVEGDSYKINWASLFKQPSCVEYLVLIDEQHHQRKRFITTLSDVNFPIEYKKSICELKIKVKMRATESYFVTNARVKCETDLDRYRAFPAEQSDTISAHTASSTSNVAIICATVLTVADVGAIAVVATVILIVNKKQVAVQERPREVGERNDLYGTYYQGADYNIAGDNNPRYNEDEGNADAVIIDQNVYFQI